MVHSISLFLLAVFIKPPRRIIMDHWKESFWKLSPACFKPPNLLPFLLGGLPQYPKLPFLKAPSILTTKHQAVFKYIVLRLFFDIWNRHAIVSSCFLWSGSIPTPQNHQESSAPHWSRWMYVGLFFLPPKKWVKPWFPMVSLGWKKPDSKAQRGYTVTPFTTGWVPSCFTVTLMADKILLSQIPARNNTNAEADSNFFCNLMNAHTHRNDIWYMMHPKWYMAYDIWCISYMIYKYIYVYVYTR